MTTLRAPLVAALFLAASPALAHFSFETAEVPAGSTTTAVLRVTHGCDGAATTAIRVLIPDGVIDARPMPKAGWTLEVVTGPYAAPATLHGETVTDGVREIVWSGGDLADAFFDEFTFRARVPDGDAGTVVAVPIVQTCGETQVRWDQVAAEGHSAHDLEFPAPSWVLAEPVHTH